MPWQLTSMSIEQGLFNRVKSHVFNGGGTLKEFINDAIAVALYREDEENEHILYDWRKHSGRKEPKKTY